MTLVVVMVVAVEMDIGWYMGYLLKMLFVVLLVG